MTNQDSPLKTGIANRAVGVAESAAVEIERVLLIPGLMEPRIAMWPLRMRMRKFCSRVDVWRDCYMFRNVERTVSRLAELIDARADSGKVAIITHSFGDWVARQAIARTRPHRVAALVSITPVMARGCLTTALYYLGGGLVPELAIIADEQRARAALDCDAHLRRMVIWAASDWGVSPIDLTGLPNTEVHRVMATHLSVVLQPNVHRMVEEFLFRPANIPSQAF